MKTNTLVPWPGGKSRLAAQLFPLFDNTHKTYVEPFAGAAAMLFLRPEPAKVEVLNDAQRDLVTLYRVVQHHLDEFVRQFRWQLVARDEFQRLLKADPDTLTDIQRAARFFYLQKNAFGGKVTGRSFGVRNDGPPGFNLLRLEQDLSDAHLRLARVVVENLDWRECMRRYDGPATFFFADPPYWQTEGYGVPFGLEQYHGLADQMRQAKGKVLLTVNDHPDMRTAFEGFRIKRLKTSYSLGRSGASKAQERFELAIRNW